MLCIFDKGEKPIENLPIKFNRRNVNAIANNYDASVMAFDLSTSSATLKDSRGRLLWVHNYSRRFLSKKGWL